MLVEPVTQESRHILQGDDWNMVCVANTDEVRCFDRGFDIDRSSQDHQLVGNNADDPVIQPCEAYNHVFGPERMHL